MGKVNLSNEIIRDLINEAFAVRENAYAVYSNFAVGAAALSDDGGVFTGCNVENASYPAGSCAETVAVNKAVSEGVRKIKAIAIVGGEVSPEAGQQEEAAEAIVDVAGAEAGNQDEQGFLVRDYTYPCGICRQVISEFSSDEGTAVIIAKSADDYKIYDLSELFVGAFTL